MKKRLAFAFLASALWLMASNQAFAQGDPCPEGAFQGCWDNGATVVCAGGTKSFTFKPCNFTLATYNLSVFLQGMSSCCNSTTAGDQATFNSCMTSWGNWLCPSCKPCPTP
jgi:hypothetical protein